MDKLSELKEQVKVLLEGTQDTDLIQSLASINDTIQGVEKEQSQLMDKNVELAEKYKEAILHGGFNKEPIEDTTGTKVVDFDNMLKDYIKEINK